MQLNLLLYDTAAEEITSGQSNLTRGCIAAADGRFIRIRQNGRAHWRNLANTIERVLHSATRVHNPNGKSIGSAIFAQLTAECRWVCPAMSFPLIIALICMGDLGPI